MTVPADISSEYEARRAENLRVNADMLAALGLKINPTPTPAPTSKSARPTHKKRTREVQVAPRASRRIRGDAPTSSERVTEYPEVVITHSARGDYTKRLWMGRKQLTGSIAVIKLPDAISLPFTLTSIATSILDIGRLVTDPAKKGLYWSNRGCMFRHPYPVGYRASKRYFHKEWFMRIDEGEYGPVFEVSDGNGTTYRGATPTKPWTDICIKSTTTGTRISGPLFFGFSDPVVQKMIEDLDGYQSWDEWSKEKAAIAEQEAATALETSSQENISL